ncbi:cobalt-precorrin-6A reductase [Sphaerisporangium sp. B11E5]|uniref:cobalt-precorrin-6A reductase n=1 Tax=Sphaerisporangium sp. B11E5 TaxID=3153563 RepID=UPI00325EE47A
MPRRVLILGGTAEARALAATLTQDPGLHVISSLAGRVTNPRLPEGEVRLGGFGGPDGLSAYLTTQNIQAVIDATHPFAEKMTASATEATTRTRTPYLILRRPAWHPTPQDHWHPAPSLTTAAETLRTSPHQRVFLTTGRRSLPAFTPLTTRWFLARSVDPPDLPVPPNVHILLARGPYTVPGERHLLQTHDIDVLITKNSGGPLTTAKLTAARELNLPVIMIERPALPDDVPRTETVEEAARWLLSR